MQLSGFLECRCQAVVVFSLMQASGCLGHTYVHITHCYKQHYLKLSPRHLYGEMHENSWSISSWVWPTGKNPILIFLRMSFLADLAHCDILPPKSYDLQLSNWICESGDVKYTGQLSLNNSLSVCYSWLVILAYSKPYSIHRFHLWLLCQCSIYTECGCKLMVCLLFASCNLASLVQQL